MSKKCAFCTNVENERRDIIKNDLVWVFPTNIPIVPGHVLVCPVRCVATFDDLTTEERVALFDVLKKLKIALKKTFKTDGFNYAWNEGVEAGQSVPHIHLHVLPRKKGDSGITKYEPTKFLYRPGSREETPKAELQAVAKLVRDNLD